MSTRDTETLRGPDAPSNFISDIIEDDLEAGRRQVVVTRFPPEPNGYPHIGHAQSICLNFGLAQEYGGRCHLRFDDTNPETEDLEYVEAIKRDVKWLGFDWGEHEYYASDYFEQLYDWAVQLIKDGKAYVEDLNEEEIRAYRGTVTEPGRPSPYRDRSVEENLDLFRRMRDGEFENGARVLRAKIDLASPNMKMRDPLMYRIRHAHHYRRGDAWCIYPFYDWAHGQSDAIENITYSICTLEFENNRELYDWYLDNLGISPRPRQYEFARLNVEYTITSKRKLLQLVQNGYVSGWDDPRMPTISGMRRRGITPAALQAFAKSVDVTKVNGRTDIARLEYCIRDDMNYRAPRVLCVLDPLKVVVTNYPEGEEEWIDASYWPHDVPNEGTRQVPFSRELYIEREDFKENPPNKYKRLAPGRTVRLRHGYVITCDEVIKNKAGGITELRCTYDPDTLDTNPTDGRKVWGVLHWVSADHSLPAEVRLYDRLFRNADPDDGEEDFKENLNPDSLTLLKNSRVEPSVKDDAPDTRYQFERQGYFWQDPEDSSPDLLVFNRIVTLRDAWARMTEDKPAPKQEKPKVESKPTPPPEKRDPTEDLTPAQKETLLRYTDDLNLQLDDAVIFAKDADLAAFFEDALAAHDNPQSIANWIINELLREIKDTTLAEVPFDGAKLGRLVALIDDDTISGRIAKDVFDNMLETGDDPAAIVERTGLKQVSDTDVLEPMIERLMEQFPDKVEAYREGKIGLLGFFVGQVMRETKGQANPQLVQELAKEKLAT
ncbi:MAG TPA: glutamine--tRNA ligase/YqeY domain fusion protein [Rhodothermales bacterium]|nr:glutamine--tRNA ligase/YqeY domain fusion protein [Rhodothermales bacterium]